jgi:hypothetical protein
VATLGELRADVFPGALVATAGNAADLDGVVVSWVRVLRARVPAFDTLEPGDLVVVPEAALGVVAPSDGEVAELVAAFARARVAAILVLEPSDGAGPTTGIPGPATGRPGRTAAGTSRTAEGTRHAAGSVGPTGGGTGRTAGSTGPAGDTGPAAQGTGLAARGTEAPVVAASRDAGLPVLLLPGRDPSGLERTVIGYLVNRRAELEHRAAQLEGRLEGLALESADLPALVAEIGSFLGRPVALEGRRGDALAVHAPAGDPASAAIVARYMGGGSGGILRVRLPGGRAGGGHGGSLVLLGERPPSELERIAADRIAGVLALQLARDEAVRRARDAGRRADPLPSAGPPWVVLLARQVGAEGHPTIESRESVRRELRLLAPATRLTLRGDAESLELRLVLAANDDPGALALGERIASFLGRTVALSRPFATPGDRPTAEADARATLEAAESLDELEPDRIGPRVARADRLAAYRLLGGLHNVPEGHRHARQLLGPILSGRPERVADRLATLRAVLDAPGAAEAATILGVHRNTLAYRIRRLEAMTGWRLTDPELRLALSVAVRLVQIAQ